MSNQITDVLSGDTFEYADFPANAGRKRAAEDLELMREFFSKSQTSDAGGDAEFDNFVGFYEIVDTTGGTASPADEDLIA